MLTNICYIRINSIFITGKDTVHNLYCMYKLHFHYVLSMGAVFALYSAWYFWIPKILGLDYNKMLGKAHFWILFIGVKAIGRMYFFDASKMSGKRFNHDLAGPGGKSVFCYNQKGEELIFPSINGAKQHFHVRWTLIKKSIDTGQSISLNGEPWIIQSLPRPAC